MLWAQEVDHVYGQGVKGKGEREGCYDAHATMRGSRGRWEKGGRGGDSGGSAGREGRSGEGEALGQCFGHRKWISSIVRDGEASGGGEEGGREGKEEALKGRRWDNASGTGSAFTVAGVSLGTLRASLVPL